MDPRGGMEQPRVQRSEAELAPPIWTKCFCDGWTSGVVYSPSGPWFSDELLDRLLVSYDGRGSTTVPGGGRASPMASTLRVRDIMAMPPPAGALTAELLGSAKHRQLFDAPLLSGGDVPSGGYSDNAFVARRDTLRCMLARVPDFLIPSAIPDSISGRSRGVVWYALKSSVDVGAYPGLGDWLTSNHSGALRQFGIDFTEVLKLITVGGDTGIVGLGRPTAKGHPLAKEATGLGTFYKAALPRGSPLGFYPGLLCDMDLVEAWMNSLPKHLDRVDSSDEEGGEKRVDRRRKNNGSSSSAGNGAPSSSSLSSSATAAVSSVEASSSAGAAVSSTSTSVSSGAAGNQSDEAAPVPLPYADMMCRAKLWTYDYAAPALPGGIPVHTYLGAFVRNAMCGVNDYHQIGDEPNVQKIPLLLGGVIPLVLFATARPVKKFEEALLEYGPDWYSTYVGYVPSAKGIFFQKKNLFEEITMQDIFLSTHLGLKQRTRHAQKGGKDALLATATAAANAHHSSSGSSSGSGAAVKSKHRGSAGAGSGRGRGRKRKDAAAAAVGTDADAAAAATEAAKAASVSGVDLTVEPDDVLIVPNGDSNLACDNEGSGGPSDAAVALPAPSISTSSASSFPPSLLGSSAVPFTGLADGAASTYFSDGSSSSSSSSSSVFHVPDDSVSPPVPAVSAASAAHSVSSMAVSAASTSTFGSSPAHAATSTSAVGPSSSSSSSSTRAASPLSAVTANFNLTTMPSPLSAVTASSSGVPPYFNFVGGPRIVSESFLSAAGTDVASCPHFSAAAAALAAASTPTASDSTSFVPPGLSHDAITHTLVRRWYATCAQRHAAPTVSYGARMLAARASPSSSLHVSTASTSVGDSAPPEPSPVALQTIPPSTSPSLSSMRGSSVCGGSDALLFAPPAASTAAAAAAAAAPVTTGDAGAGVLHTGVEPSAAGAGGGKQSKLKGGGRYGASGTAAAAATTTAPSAKPSWKYVDDEDEKMLVEKQSEIFGIIPEMTLKDVLARLEAGGRGQRKRASTTASMSPLPSVSTSVSGGAWAGDKYRGGFPAHSSSSIAPSSSAMNSNSNSSKWIAVAKPTGNSSSSSSSSFLSSSSRAQLELEGSNKTAASAAASSDSAAAGTGFLSSVAGALARALSSTSATDITTAAAAVSTAAASAAVPTLSESSASRNINLHGEDGKFNLVIGGEAESVLVSSLCSEDEGIIAASSSSRGGSSDIDSGDDAADDSVSVTCEQKKARKPTAPRSAVAAAGVVSKAKRGGKPSGGKQTTVAPTAPVSSSAASSGGGSGGGELQPARNSRLQLAADSVAESTEDTASTASSTWNGGASLLYMSEMRLDAVLAAMEAGGRGKRSRTTSAYPSASAGKHATGSSVASTAADAPTAAGAAAGRGPGSAAKRAKLSGVADARKESAKAQRQQQQKRAPSNKKRANKSGGARRGEINDSSADDEDDDAAAASDGDDSTSDSDASGGPTSTSAVGRSAAHSSASQTANSSASAAATGARIGSSSNKSSRADLPSKKPRGRPRKIPLGSTTDASSSITTSTSTTANPLGNATAETAPAFVAANQPLVRSTAARQVVAPAAAAAAAPSAAALAHTNAEGVSAELAATAAAGAASVSASQRQSIPRKGAVAQQQLFHPSAASSSTALTSALSAPSSASFVSDISTRIAAGGLGALVTAPGAATAAAASAAAAAPSVSAASMIRSKGTAFSFAPSPAAAAAVSAASASCAPPQLQLPTSSRSEGGAPSSEKQLQLPSSGDKRNGIWAKGRWEYADDAAVSAPIGREPKPEELIINGPRGRSAAALSRSTSS